MNQTKIGKYLVSYNNKEEFHIIKREIFSNDCYYIETTEKTPLIIDVGAHIGLATLYFKTIYPASRIIAIEALKQNFEILQTNINSNNLKDVVLVNKALNSTNKKISFNYDETEKNWFSTASIIPGAWNQTQKTTEVEIDSITFAEIFGCFTENVTIMKIDIEGMEHQILSDIKKFHSRIDNLVIELHPTKNANISKFIGVLDNFYNIELSSEGVVFPVSKLNDYAKQLILARCSKKK